MRSRAAQRSAVAQRRGVCSVGGYAVAEPRPRAPKGVYPYGVGGATTEGVYPSIGRGATGGGGALPRRHHHPRTAGDTTRAIELVEKMEDLLPELKDEEVRKRTLEELEVLRTEVATFTKEARRCGEEACVARLLESSAATRRGLSGAGGGS